MWEDDTAGPGETAATSVTSLSANDESNVGLNLIVAIMKWAFAQPEVRAWTPTYTPNRPFHPTDAVGRPLPDELPIFTATHESRILTECVEHRLPCGTAVTPRPCAFGNQCQGLREEIRGHTQSGGGFILREAVTPIELAAFEARGEHPPTERRPCVLCCRHSFSGAYHAIRFGGIASRAQQCCVFNWYVNPRGCEQGYESAAMVPCEARARCVPPRSQRSKPRVEPTRGFEPRARVPRVRRTTTRSGAA